MSRKKVTDNQYFLSIGYRILQVRKSTKLSQLIGEYDKPGYASYKNSQGGESLRCKSYIFGKTDNKRFKKGVLIQIKSATGTGYFLPDIFASVQNKLASGIENIDRNKYQYCISAGSVDVIDVNIVKYLEKQGYLGANAYMYKAIARRVGARNNTLFLLVYAEDINADYTVKDWINPLLLNDTQKEFLTAFLKRASDSTQIRD